MSARISNLTYAERKLYDKVLEIENKANQWLSIVHLLVTKYGENYKLVINDANKFVIPALNNPIQFDYNKETDTLIIEIIEEPEKKIIEV